MQPEICGAYVIRLIYIRPVCPHYFCTHVQLRVWQVEIVLPTTPHNEFYRGTVCYTRNWVKFYHPTILNASLRGGDGENVKFALRAFARLGVNECHDYENMSSVIPLLPFFFFFLFLFFL